MDQSIFSAAELARYNRHIIIPGFGMEAQEKLKNSMIFGTQDFGRGQIVYLANDPIFRGFWQNGKLLFGNAVFIVGN